MDPPPFYTFLFSYRLLHNKALFFPFHLTKFLRARQPCLHLAQMCYESNLHCFHTGYFDHSPLLFPIPIPSKIAQSHNHKFSHSDLKDMTVSLEKAVTKEREFFGKVHPCSMPWEVRSAGSIFQGISTSFYLEPTFSLLTLKTTQIKHKFPTPIYKLIQIDWNIIARTSSQCVSIQNAIYLWNDTSPSASCPFSSTLSQWSCFLNPRNFPVRGELPTFPLWRAGSHSCTSLHFLHSVVLMSPPVWWKANRDSEKKHKNKRRRTWEGRRFRKNFPLSIQWVWLEILQEETVLLCKRRETPWGFSLDM